MCAVRGAGIHGIGISSLIGGISRSSLPQYLLNNIGTEKEIFTSVSEWTVETGSADDNTTAGEFRSGDSSIKMTTALGVSTKMIKTFPSFSFPSGTRIRLYVYLYAADFANIDRFYVSFSAAGWANYVQATFVYTEQNFHAGWNVLDCPLWKWSIYGTGWSTNFTLLRIWLIAKTGTVCSASVDSLIVGIEGVPAALITFDDGMETVYSNAFSYMQTRSARGTFFIDTSKPGTAGQVTVPQLLEMNAAGWSIGNHSDAITDLTTLTQAEVQTHISAAKTTLDGWGLTKASRHLAYPSGGWNDVTIAALAAESFLTGRTIMQSSFPILDDYGDDLLSYKIYTYPGSTFAAMKVGIDRAFSSKVIYGFVTHQIPGDVTLEDFQSMIDYIQSLGMPFITINDLYDSLSGQIYL